jgi:hypothetical protein
VLSTNTPGQENVGAIFDPCGITTSIITHTVFTYNDVTVSPPGGKPSTGGLVFTTETTGDVSAPESTMTLATNGLLEPTTTTEFLLLSHSTIVGSDGLGGVTGVAEGEGHFVGTYCAAGSIGFTFGTVTCTSVGQTISAGIATPFWFELDNVPHS